MFKGYAIKDIFYLLLGSLLVIGIIMAYITMGGWGELTHSSQSSKVIHKQQKRTVTEDVLKENIEEFVYKPCPTCTLEGEGIEQLSKTNSDWQTFETTYYLATCKGCTGETYYKGYDVTDTIYYKGYRVIAVDPDVIKLGSIVKVKTHYGTFKAVAIDIGSNIQNSRIDILVDDYDLAMRLGRHNVQLKILSEGKF